MAMQGVLLPIFCDKPEDASEEVEDALANDARDDQKDVGAKFLDVVVKRLERARGDDEGHEGEDK